MDQWRARRLGGLYANDIADDDRRSYRAAGYRAPLPSCHWWRDGNLCTQLGLFGSRQGESGAELRIRPRPETFTTDRRLIDSRRLAAVDSLATPASRPRTAADRCCRRVPALAGAARRRRGRVGRFDGGYVSASWMITGERRSYSESGGAFGGVNMRTFERRRARAASTSTMVR
ncbi:MAG: hypothetical protein U1F11_10905 [Steroidobacteraceae bacterium]